MQHISNNTQAILLLTAPLMLGRGAQSVDLLTPSEYKRLAALLHQLNKQPADLISTQSDEIIQQCRAVVEENRIKRLLGRGFLLSQVVERWSSRGIWVISRADSEYPRRLKARLRNDAPAILYGCGDISLLEAGGLAVVGSRKIDDALAEYATYIGGLTASTNRAIVSGGAKGVDLAAMRGALQSGGKVVGVLAENLERVAMNRDERNYLRSGGLVLVSAYDPNAGFNIGHAMQRNKLIYALADISLVVEAELNKGGTWAGAVEQLDKLRFVPLFVRSTGKCSAGLDALSNRGAVLWPNPHDTESLNELFFEAPSYGLNHQHGISFTSVDEADAQKEATVVRKELFEAESSPLFSDGLAAGVKVGAEKQNGRNFDEPHLHDPNVYYADVLFSAVRDIIVKLLANPAKDSELAAALNITTVQARIWLQRLVDEGLIEKQKKQGVYVLRKIK